MINHSTIINGAVVSSFDPRILCFRLPIKKSIGNPNKAPAANNLNKVRDLTVQDRDLSEKERVHKRAELKQLFEEKGVLQAA